MGFFSILRDFSHAERGIQYIRTRIQILDLEFMDPKKKTGSGPADLQHCPQPQYTIYLLQIRKLFDLELHQVGEKETLEQLLAEGEQLPPRRWTPVHCT
jgi:hypothetical protein